MADTDSSSERLSELRARWEGDRRSRIFLQLAEEYRRQGQPLEAMAVLDEGLSRHPSSVAGKVLQGRCRLESGQAEAAAATLEEVVSRDPTHIVAYRWLTEAYLELGDTEQARRRLEIYTQLNPQGEDLSDLSRRLVALEDPARRLSVGAEPSSEVKAPQRPSPAVTEAPTTITPIPPELASRAPETEQPTVSVPLGDLPLPEPPSAPPPGGPSAEAPAGTEAPTVAVSLSDLPVPEASPTASPSQPPGEPGSGALPWGREAEARPDQGTEQETSVTDPPASEAKTARLRLESLGLVPDARPAEPAASETPAADPGAVDPTAVESEPSGPQTEAVEAIEGESKSELPATEQPTGEIPWWRPRRPAAAPPEATPESSPWDTQESEAQTGEIRPLAAGRSGVAASPADTATQEVDAEDSEAEERSPASEAPTGIFDTASLVSSAPPPSSIDAESSAAPEASVPGESSSPAATPEDDGMVFRDSVPIAETAPAEPFTDLFAPPAGARRDADDADVLGLERGDGGAAFDGHRSTVLFALDPGGLLDAIDLSSVPTRPLSIPLWLAGPGAELRPVPAEEPVTPTLAQLYRDQGHSREADVLDETPRTVEEPTERVEEPVEPVEEPTGQPEALSNELRSAGPVGEVTASFLLGDYQPERGGLSAKQVYVLQQYLSRLRGGQGGADVS